MSGMKKVFVTRNIPDRGLTVLREKGYEVDVSTKDGVLTRPELLSALRAKPYDAVLCLLTDHIDREVFEAAPTAKIFANYAVGFDNINVEDAKAHGVTITNTPGVLTDSVAEHTFALMMALMHRIVESDQYIRSGKYEGWAPMLLLGLDMKGKILGILWAGRIGHTVAHHACHGFGMRVLYYDVKRNEELERDMDARFCSTIEEVLKEADVVSLHVPLLPSTKHLINAETLRLMKPTAYLVNTSRGAVIDEEALVQALQKGIIKGAALDVFENGPRLTPGLAELLNVVLTPHTASATEETRAAMSALAAENIIAFFEEKTPPNAIA